MGAAFRLASRTRRVPIPLNAAGAGQRTANSQDFPDWPENRRNAISGTVLTEHSSQAGAGKSDSTRRHEVVALERLQKFALEHKLLEKPVFGKLEKPRVGVGTEFQRCPRPRPF